MACFFQDSVKNVEPVFFEFIAGQEIDAAKQISKVEAQEDGLIYRRKVL
jgi:hypothetical protein